MAVTGVSEPINAIVNAKGLSRNKLAIEIGGFSHNFDFKSGGELTDPVSYEAHAHGGISAQGLYAAWTCEGTVTVSKSMYETMLKMHKASAEMGKPRGATHTAYVAADGGIEAKHVFKNVIVSAIPHFPIAELGATVDLNIKFSLNHLVTVE
jgi:hypothetical protein